MRHQIKRVEFIESYRKGIFAEYRHAKRISCLANGALGGMTSASLAVSIIGQSLPQARGLLSKHAIKQVDRLLSKQGIVVWDIFAPWVAQVVTKDLRFGMGMSALRIADPQRRDRLLRLNAFAIVLLTHLGAAGESLGMDRHLKVNTAKHKTHSLFTGLHALRVDPQHARSPPPATCRTL